MRVGGAPELLRGPEVLLCKFRRRTLDMADLKLMQLSTVGYEHLRHLGLADRPLRVCNARGVFDTAIAEWNLAMMVNLIRDLRGMIRNQEQAVWERAARFQQEIRGRVVGLWGYGGIGRETARLAKAFGLTVHVLTRSGRRAAPRHLLPAGDRRPGRRAARPRLHRRPGAGVSGRAGLPGPGPAAHAAERRHDRRERVAGAAADGVRAEPGARADHPGGGAAASAARGLDRRGGAGHALRLSAAAGASAVALPQRHPDAAHLRADQSRHFPARIADLFVQNVERYLAAGRCSTS